MSTDVFRIKYGTFDITVHSLTSSHFFRLQNAPVDLKKPAVPDGYTHEKALELVEEYGKLWARYENSIEVRRIVTILGACRLKAIDAGDKDAIKERDDLKVRCKRLSMPHPDETDDPLECGDRLTSLYEDVTGALMDILDFSVWARLSAGGVEPARIAEVLKSLRADGERGTSGDGDPGATEDSGKGKTKQGKRGDKPVVRHRRGSGKARADKVAV